MRATLQQIEPAGSDITMFWFKPEESLRYTAGQFIELAIPHDNHDDRGVRRWFTLSSSPTEDLVAISTRHCNRPSTFKQALFGLKQGDAVEISQAMGDFVLPMQRTVPVLLVAAGIGITPVRSITKSLLDKKDSRSVHITYLAHSAADHVFKDLLTSYQPNTTFLISDGTQAEQLENNIFSSYKKEKRLQIYLSGPEAFVEQLYKRLLDSGIPSLHLVTDYFHGYQD